MGITPSKCIAPDIKGNESSEGYIEKIKQIMKESLTSKNSDSKIKVLTEQSIKITPKIDKEYPELTKQEYICPSYSKMSNGSFPMYECNYDISQKSDIKILKIDETVLANVTNIVSKMEAEIKNNFPAVGSDKKESKGLKDPVIMDKIKNIMIKYKEEKISKVPGEINIEITKPIKCNNPCDGDNANPKINSDIVIDKLVDEIYDELPVNKRIIEYKDKQKLNVGDKMKTPEERKKLKDYCTAVIVANIVVIFTLACIINWIILLLFG